MYVRIDILCISYTRTLTHGNNIFFRTRKIVENRQSTSETGKKLENSRSKNIYGIMEKQNVLRNRNMHVDECANTYIIYSGL